MAPGVSVVNSLRSKVGDGFGIVCVAAPLPLPLCPLTRVALRILGRGIVAVEMIFLRVVLLVLSVGFMV
jgi:hypothetical protein